MAARVNSFRRKLLTSCSIRPCFIYGMWAQTCTLTEDW